MLPQKSATFGEGKKWDGQLNHGKMQLLKLDVFSATVFVTSNHELTTFIIRVVMKHKNGFPRSLHVCHARVEPATSWNDVGTWLLHSWCLQECNILNTQSPNHSTSKKIHSFQHVHKLKPSSLSSCCQGCYCPQIYALFVTALEWWLAPYQKDTLCYSKR